jgi:hypothetical protein
LNARLDAWQKDVPPLPKISGLATPADSIMTEKDAARLKRQGKRRGEDFSFTID